MSCRRAVFPLEALSERFERWRRHAKQHRHIMSAYLDAINSGRVMILDGATGTTLQRFELTLKDFGGPSFEGCNEMLNVLRPDVVADVHRSFFDVGVDATETNTFGAFSVPLGEYDIADRAYELAAAGAAIAREVTDEYIADDGRQRFVAGSIGPGTKFASLGQITYADLRDGYETEAAGLLDGGADFLLIETQFDLLGVRAAVNGARRAMAHSGREVPLQVQVTIELTGRMLPGPKSALPSPPFARPDQTRGHGTGAAAGTVRVLGP